MILPIKLAKTRFYNLVLSIRIVFGIDETSNRRVKKVKFLGFQTDVPEIDTKIA